MSKSEALAWLTRSKIVPVLRASSESQALDAAQLLKSGGIDVFEVTMTVPGALSVIEQLRREFGSDALVGAGTVLDAVAVRESLAVGAQFIVAPNTDEAVIAACQEAEVLCAPGALTPTEILTAHRLGADVVKVFPCDAVGGPAYIRGLKAPLPHIALMPTGGVAVENVAAFLRAGACCLGVGSNLVDLNRPERIPHLARSFRTAAGLAATPR